tara:strand:- start:1025 stop:1873 length:849 start_codon:yes stop_codon:yes gene_type:complete
MTNSKVYTFEASDYASIKSIQRDLISEKFSNTGFVLFTGFENLESNLIDFTDQYTDRYAKDTNRREARLGNENIKNVDSGTNEIKLHSEASFAPSWPEILWFFCKSPCSNGGNTTFCNSLELWKSLEKDTKSFFLGNPIKYLLSLPIDIRKKSKGKKRWFLEEIGASNVNINWETSSLELELLRFAVTECRFSNKLSFSNHLLVDLESEPQILSRTLSNGQEIPADIMNEIKEKAAELTFASNWKKGELVMLDNKRFLHGRESFETGSSRDIVLVQTLKTNL